MTIIPHIESEFFTRSVGSDGKVSYVLTGVVLFEPVKGTGDEWLRTKVDFSVPLRNLGVNKALRLDFWAPFVTLTSISNDRTATNAGWAVDGFEIAHPEEVMRGRVGVSAQVAVRDSDGFINRLAYNIHLIGHEV